MSRLSLQKKVMVVVFVIIGLFALAGLLPMTLFVNKDKVDYSACYGDLLAARQLVLTYRQDKGEYPASIDEIFHLYGVYHERIFICPRTKREGKMMRFKYFLPPTNAPQEYLLLVSPNPNYVVGKQIGHLGVSVGGKAVFRRTLE